MHPKTSEALHVGRADLLMMEAELVLPIPGGPLRRIAFLDMSLGLPPPLPLPSAGC